MEEKLCWQHTPGEQVCNAPIKQEVEWMPEDLHAPDEYNQDFATEKDSSRCVKTEVKVCRRNSHIHTYMYVPDLGPQTPKDACEYTKTEFIFDEKFLDDRNDPYSIYTRERQQNDLKIADEQQPRINISDKDKESCELNPSTRAEELMTKTLSEKIFQCKLCPQSFSYKNSLVRHSRTHDDHRSRNYTCEQCGSKFFSKSSLKRHCLTHTEDRKREFICHLCEKNFYSQRGLELHMKLHTGDTHNCKVCGACFTIEKNLTNHIIRYHSGETPYKCRLCGKSFKTELERSEHACSHQKLRLQCELCDKTFANKDTRRAHSKEHTGLPWKCRICEKKFSTTVRVRTHVGGVHKITDKEAINKQILKVLTAKEL